MSDLQQITADLTRKAVALGALDADAVAILDAGTSVRVRNGAVESIERSEAQGVGLRVYVRNSGGLAFASASSSDLSPAGLELLARRTLQLAQISAPDPDALPPSGADHPAGVFSATIPATPWQIEQAKAAAIACEAAALGYSDQIINCEGADAGFGYGLTAYACADGFVGSYASTSCSFSVSAIASSGGKMQRDYDYSQGRTPTELLAPEQIGRNAAERAVRRLGASSFVGGKMPVVFEPRIATSLLRSLAGAINGRSVLQKATFLHDAVGSQLFPEFINIVDDPFHPKAPQVRHFDGEGTRSRRHTLIEAGQLTGYLTDRYAARRLNAPETGHARRGLTGDLSIGPSTLLLDAGAQSLPELLASLGDALLVTELLGSGVNGVTGDYSRGAAGFLVQGGQIVRPVCEITLAGNLRTMFQNIIAVGSDLTWFGGIATPSIAIDGMTIAGQDAG